MAPPCWCDRQNSERLTVVVITVTTRMHCNSSVALQTSSLQGTVGESHSEHAVHMLCHTVCSKCKWQWLSFSKKKVFLQASCIWQCAHNVQYVLQSRRLLFALQLL